jgi:hypothetical protein
MFEGRPGDLLTSTAQDNGEDAAGEEAAHTEHHQQGCCPCRKIEPVACCGKVYSARIT